MSWKAVTVEQRRLEIVLAPTVLSISVTEACRRFGVSRQQFYEWRRRWENDGIEGLRERSRRPRTSPFRITETLEEEICRLRADHSDWGPRRIRAELVRQGVNPPAKSTVQRTLERNGLISPQPRKRRASTRFERPSPNELWQIDAMDMELTDGTEVHVINLLDDHARFLLASRASLVLDGIAAWDCFSIAINDHGVPKEVLSDNGRYFSGEHWNLVSAFERKLWALGHSHHSLDAVAPSDPRQARTNAPHAESMAGAPAAGHDPCGDAATTRRLPLALQPRAPSPGHRRQHPR